MRAPDRHLRLPRCGRLLAFAAALALGRGGAAQPADAPTVELGAPRPVAAAPGLVDVKVASFGLGGGARPGDWCPVEIELLSRLDKPATVIVQLPEADPDGDDALRQRAVVANPNLRQRVWLYTRLPFRPAGSMAFRITVHEAREAGAAAGGEGPLRPFPRYLPGRLLGELSFRPSALVNPFHSLIAVVGQVRAGLEQYTVEAQVAFTRSSAPDSISAHELTHLISGLAPADLPDRWHGFMALDALVWSAGLQVPRPQDLSPSQSDAIREWVRRGGHLVVLLPAAGQDWIGRSDHLLTTIMPAVQVRPKEGVDLNPFRPLIAADPRSRAPLPRRATVNVFLPDPGAPYGQAIRVLNGPDGQCVVVRRLVGAGAVTLVGLPLAQGDMATRGVIEADTFWNRVLGRRVDTFSSADSRDARQQPAGGYSAFNRADWFLESGIENVIRKSSEAATGLLLAFVVFLAYWLLAGPVGFFALRRRGLKHHSWVAFLAAAGLFTAVAWGGANWLKPRRVEARHLTILDHVYGQDSQRARAFVNILLPRYGDERIAVGEPAIPGAAPAPSAASADGRFDAIAAWEPPSYTGLTSDTASFPDARSLPADAAQPDFLIVPTRATVKQFRADWAGPPRWSMLIPRPETPSTTPPDIGSEIRLLSTPGGGWRLSGSLTHGLPVPLTNVILILVRQQTPLAVGSSPTEAIVGRAAAFTPFGSDPWLPGATLDLSAISSDAAVARRAGMAGVSAFMDTLLPRSASTQLYRGDTEAAIRGSIENKLVLLSLYGVLPPAPRDGGAFTLPIARRQMTHGLDLGRWFTHPCLIILAQADGADCPAPLLAGGRPVPATGLTIVRWIYPLADNPPEVVVPDPSAAPAEDAPAPARPAD